MELLTIIYVKNGVSIKMEGLYMKKILLFLGVLMICTIVFAGCSTDLKSKDTNKSTVQEKTKQSENYQKFSTELYEISIPGDWKTDTKPGNAVSFILNEKIIGGIEVISHYPDQPLSSIMPNHSEVLEQEEVKEFLIKA